MTYNTPEAGIEEVLNNNRNETLYDSEDANQIAADAINNFIEVVLPELNQIFHQARHDWIREVIEIVESVQLTATRQHAKDTTPERAKLVNDWLMPEVKRSIIEAIHSKLDQDRTTLTQNSNRKV